MESPKRKEKNLHQQPGIDPDGEAEPDPIFVKKKKKQLEKNLSSFDFNPKTTVATLVLAPDFSCSQSEQVNKTFLRQVSDNGFVQSLIQI